MSTNDRLIGELGYVPLGTTNSTAPMTTHLESVVERLRAQSAELSRWLGPRSAGEPETMTEAADRIEADAATIAAQAERIEALARFLLYCMQEGSWSGYDLDGGAAQDEAERLGLIVSEPYSVERHGDRPEFAEGDRIYDFPPWVYSVLATPSPASLVTPKAKT